jgi:ADP-ribose pyrophosphatase YjhB (NUDIX family)
MARAPIPSWFFALVIVRLGRRFLLVREKKHGQRWYLPAGRVEPGETLAEGAIRETLEESGVPIVLDGVVRIEHSPAIDGSARCRVFFLARPADDTPPLSSPNEHSLEARWVTLEELDQLPLRDNEVRAAMAFVLGGGFVAPLSILTVEGARWSDGSSR